jgi:hypothetical protein
MNKEQAYKMVQDALDQCTVEQAHHSAVIVIFNEKESKVKVYGLNIDEMEVASLLLDAAHHVAEGFDTGGKTIQ